MRRRAKIAPFLSSIYTHTLVAGGEGGGGEYGDGGVGGDTIKEEFDFSHFGLLLFSSLVLFTSGIGLVAVEGAGSLKKRRRKMS